MNGHDYFIVALGNLDRFHSLIRRACRIGGDHQVALCVVSSQTSYGGHKRRVKIVYDLVSLGVAAVPFKSGVSLAGFVKSLKNKLFAVA